MNTVNKSIGISPGKLFEHHAAKQNKLLKRRIEISNSVVYKKRKLQLKSKLKFDNIRSEVQEGQTYQSGIATCSITDITEIPPLSIVQITEKVKTEEFVGVCKIFCDIETTSLQKVDARPLKEALNLFVTFIEKNRPCILVGHNFMKFDFPRIIRAFEIALSLHTFSMFVLCLADTLIFI